MQTFLCEGRGTGAGSRHPTANGGPPSFLVLVQTSYSTYWPLRDTLEQILSDIKQDNKVVFVVLDWYENKVV